MFSVCFIYSPSKKEVDGVDPETGTSFVCFCLSLEKVLLFVRARKRVALLIGLKQHSFSICAIFNGLNSLKTSWQLLTIDKFYSVWRVTHLFTVLDSLSGVCHFHFAFKLKINFIKTKIEWKSGKKYEMVLKYAQIIKWIIFFGRIWKKEHNWTITKKINLA